MSHAHRSIPTDQPSPAPGRRRIAGFTLAELIVAVGAVALLTLGIGQIFTSVGKLVGSGSALAETDQAARAISAQLEEDFRALGRQRLEDTFFAIRNRRVGDVNKSGSVNPNNGERAIYLRAEDREFDIRQGIAPYEPGSRAVTRRLDEMIFIAFAGSSGTYNSSQFEADIEGETTARIAYGHGLRPAPDLQFDPRAASINSRLPRRLWAPDGDFGQRPGETNRFDAAGEANGGLVSGRNEFAADWLLLRQPVVLYPGRLVDSEAVEEDGRDFAFAPYLRDTETIARFAGQGSADQTQWSGYNFNNIDRPNMRLISRGRVDVCAQDLDSVRRWLEGAAPATSPIAEDATAFISGRYDVPVAPFPVVGSGDPDAPLWQRGATPGPAGVLENLRAMQAAIAGCFTRVQAQAEPPFIDTGVDLVDPSEGFPPGFSGSSGFAPDAFMDNHAVLAARCSNFEIAWSDGSTTWNIDTPLDTDGDGEPDLARGDLVWFDMDFMRNAPGAGNDLSDGRENLYPRPTLTTPSLLVEIPPGERTLLNPPFPNAPVYDIIDTRAAENSDHEYLAIWPFRTPLEGGALPTVGGQPKPRLIRVRITLHDAQFRIPGGRRYEFVYRIDLR